MPRKEVIQMPIAWKAIPVAEAMDRIEETLQAVSPEVEKCRQEVLEASRGANLPEYLLQKINTLQYTLKETLSRLLDKVDSVRKAIPEGAVERERNRGEIKGMF